MLAGGNDKLYQYLKENELHEKSAMLKYKSKACGTYLKNVT